MPLPLGHCAIGWAAYHTVRSSSSDAAQLTGPSRWARIGFVTVLANLPDLDVLFGLLVYNNGAAVHRGPTHSLLFALLAGWFASRAWRWWRRIPRFGFTLCFSLIFSHVAADMFLTSSPVSLFWPLEIYFSPGNNGWGEVMHMVVFRSIQDAGLVAVSLSYVCGLRLLRAKAGGSLLSALARRWSELRFKASLGKNAAAKQ